MTDTTLMTEAPATQEGQTTSQPAADVQAPAATDTATQRQADGDQAAKPEGEAKEGQGKPEGAPEKYEFAQPDGVEMDEAGLAAFSDFAKSVNLSQEAAQAMLDKLAPAMAQRQQAVIEATRQQWAETARTDKEFGGDKLTDSLASAKKALDQFGTPELRTLLNDSGLGNHPEMIRLMVRAGKAISEDSFVGGGTGAPASSKNAASSLYPNQQ